LVYLYILFHSVAHLSGFFKAVYNLTYKVATVKYIALNCLS